MNLNEFTQQLNLIEGNDTLKNKLMKEITKSNPHVELYVPWESQKKDVNSKYYLELKKKIKITKEIYISKVLIPFDIETTCTKIDEHFQLVNNCKFNKIFIILSSKQTRYELVDFDKFLFKEVYNPTAPSIKEFACIGLKLNGGELIEDLFNDKNLKNIVNSKLEKIEEKANDKFESFLYWFNTNLKNSNFSDILLNDLLFYSDKNVLNIVKEKAFNKQAYSELAQEKGYREYVRNIFENNVIK